MDRKVKYDFSVGPSALHESVAEGMQDFVQQQWGSTNHRSDRFMALYSDVVAKLKSLLGLSDDYLVLISDSGSTLMERTMQGLVSEQSFHFVMGGFSQKQQVYAERLGLRVQTAVAESGRGFDTVPKTIYPSTELICLTHCETSSGVQLSDDFLYGIKDQYPEIPMSLDMVSTAPFTDLDLSRIDSFFFSCQKLFGLPAGLGIWCIRRALASKGANDVNRGAHQRLSELVTNYDKMQTVSTPNILGVFLLDRVLSDFIQRGKQNILKHLRQRRHMLLEAIDQSPYVHNHVQNPKHLSDSIFVADYIATSDELQKRFKDAGIIVSEGYRVPKNTQIRIANFPAIPDEGYELLCEVLRG